jgi:hypothetical protein
VQRIHCELLHFRRFLGHEQAGIDHDPEMCRRLVPGIVNEDIGDDFQRVLVYATGWRAVLPVARNEVELQRAAFWRVDRQELGVLGRIRT